MPSMKIQKINANKIRFIDVSGKWHEELSGTKFGLADADNGIKTTYEVCFKDKNYPISKDTYDSLLKIVKEW